MAVPPKASRQCAALSARPCMNDESQNEQHGPEQVIDECGCASTAGEEREPPAVLQGKPR